MLAAIEDEIAAAPARAFAFDEAGFAQLTAGGRSYVAGRFATPRIDELRARAAAAARAAAVADRGAAPAERGGIRVSVLAGNDPRTDIGTLQAALPAGTLFQVASQFNCLEAPSPCIAQIADYVYDGTQGPRASVSAFPGTFLRHYHAPVDTDGRRRAVQTPDESLNLLAAVLPPAAARVDCGYLRPTNVADPEALARSLRDRFEEIRVGVHEEVEVVLGHDWGGPGPRAPDHRIAQVFTSTVAGSHGTERNAEAWATVRRQLLRAAYLGTLLAALAGDRHTVVLTLIGGGVFGNPPRDIWDAIHWALAEAEPLTTRLVDVVVNTHAAGIPPPDLDRIRERSGSRDAAADLLVRFPE